MRVRPAPAELPQARKGARVGGRSGAIPAFSFLTGSYFASVRCLSTSVSWQTFLTSRMEATLTSVQSSIAEEVSKTVLSLDPQAQVILFGSRARAQSDDKRVGDDSDWDFLVLTHQIIPQAWVRDFLHHLELKTNAVVSTVIHSQDEWLRYQHTPLYLNISREGIPIAMNYDKQTVVRYRLERAHETLKEAQLMADHQHWNATVSRLYYACFYSVHALLLHHDHNVHTHAGTKNAFHQHFVKTGQVPFAQSRFYDLLFHQRQRGDYDDFKSFSQEEVTPWLPEAERFVGLVESLVQ